MSNENNEALDSTKELDTLSDLNRKNLENNDEANNTSENNLQNDIVTKPKKTKLKERIKKWWSSRTKKQRIVIIISLILLFILLIGGIVFLVKSSSKNDEEPKKADVIVEEENYRYENGKLIFLNKQKEEIGSYNCENQNEDLCYIAYYSSEDEFDIEKNIYEDDSPILKRSSIIEDTYVFIVDNPLKEDNSIKLYNIKEETIKETYNLVKKVNNSRVILKDKNNKYGVIEFTNNEIKDILKFTYDYLGYIENVKNTFVSKINENSYLVDENGTNLTKAINGKIKNFNEVYIKVLNNDKYEVYNYSNQKTFKESYDYVELFSDYAILINDTNMNLKFYDENKLNEEGIILNNKNYLKTNIYDENNKLIETKEAFSVEENNDIITITLIGNDNKDIVINKKEGIISKSLKNINYFDGKLYIYSDTEKKSLLGTYTCTNKNNVTGNSLNNCMLASDKVFEDNDLEIPGNVGVIPVFNERFIFIYDNPDLVNDTSKTIVLYDLKKNSSLGKYNEINTYSYTGTNDITFSTVTDLQVVAKSQSGKFGVIKINLTEVTGHIGFNYNEMEKLGEFYIAKDASGYLLLDKGSGSSLIKAVPYKIRNFKDNYLKVKKDDLYYVYSCSDKTCKEVNETGYKYVELYSKYYAGVTKDNKLGVYPYTNNPKNLISGDTLIPLNLTKYYGSGTLAFKITGNIIEIGEENGSYKKREETILSSSGNEE